MTDTQTIAAIAVVFLAIAFIVWRIYITLKRQACCGSCGCNVMSPKAKKQMLAKREALKQKCQ